MTEMERFLFNTMLIHSVKAFGTEGTETDRSHHRTLYQVAKKDLWKLQEEQKLEVSLDKNK